MKKFFFSFFLSSLMLTRVLAQIGLPVVHEIKSDTADYTLDDRYWQMLEDKSGNLTFDQVIKPPVTDQFHANTVPTRGIDRAIETLWFRYRIKNTLTHEVNIFIGTGVPYVDVYTKSTTDSTWHHKVTGKYVPWSKRDDLKRMRGLTYLIPPGAELLVYERNKHDYSLEDIDNFSFDIRFTDHVIRQKYIDNTTDPYSSSSFMFGLFLIAALFNLYFFFVIRERVYLYFSLALISEGFGRFLTGTDYLFREHPQAEIPATYISFGFYFFFLILFIRNFLETFKYFPRWDKVLIGLNTFTTLLWVLTILGIISIRDAEPGLVLPFIIILISFLLFLNFPEKAVRVKVWVSLPAILLFCLLLFPIFTSVLVRHFKVHEPSFVSWIGINFTLLEEIALIWLVLSFSASLIRRYQHLQKQIALEAVEKERLAKEKEIERSQLIAHQKTELEKQVTERTAELKHSLEDLKSTQSQLIQSEKMASLGELTAGIAHEIQNPLNFVNNFSDVNTELIEELKMELATGNMQLANEIADNLKENEQKINHHGKRADAIVKGMLQHSRTSSGQKELTDINALADEYLRLAYHGLRAKDKSFNATMKTDFDNSIGNINIIPQDIGRVILNLITNAFYVVDEKKKQHQDGYEPTVSVSTKKTGSNVEISVKDNGSGIPQKVLDKIFQPFFTTKPTGQGTGLGLSLSYDIIKAHGGEIKLETKEGEGSVFIIELPYKY